MKFFATLAVASTLAFASAQDACAPTLITTATTSPEAVACKTATNFSAAAALAAFPTGADLAKICANTDCQKLLAAVTAAVPTECTLAGVKVKETLVDKFTTSCKATAGAAGAAPAKAGSGSGAPAAEVTTPAPTTKMTTAASTAGSMEKAEATTAASGSGSSTKPAGADASKAVPTPAPTPKSSASTVAAATGAVVMAVAAAML